MNLSKKFLAPLAAIAALTTPAMATSTAEVEVISVRIVYADIDLATPEGRSVLTRRIDAELRKACTFRTRYGFSPKITDDKCIRDARIKAMAQAEEIIAALTPARRQASAK